MSQGSLSRRSLLRGALALGGSGFVLAATGGEVIAASSKLASKNTPVPFTNLFRRPPVLMPTETGEDEKGKFAKFRITEKIGQQSIAYCVTWQQLSARGAAVGTPVTATFSARAL
jgi:hypothetical protein